MSDDNQKINVTPFYARHLFGLMVTMAIIIATGLVLVSMSLYYSSGASQLDLSSPSYVDIRDQIDKSDDFEDYSSTGKMNADAIAEFKSLFDQKVDKIESVDIFGGDPLNLDYLGISETTNDTSQ